MKKSAYLIGPFLGELSWEYFHFAPYIINLMKKEPMRKFIIFTRPSRFDLYGAYADVLVPLRLTNDKEYLRRCFTIEGFPQSDVDILLKIFINKYKKRYKIIDKIYPNTSNFSYKVKWQFNRNEMDYDFKPRIQNRKRTEKFIKPNHVLIDTSSDAVPLINLKNYESKHACDLTAQVTSIINPMKVTTLGCFIEAIKICKFVVGNLNSDTSRLALLLNKPLITINEKLSDDAISLINPLKTPIIRCNDVEEGIKIYEDNF